MALVVRSKEVKNNTERLICIGLIVSDAVLEQLSPILDVDFLQAKYTRQIVSWCLDYFKNFKKAPRKHIQDIFESNKRDVLDPDVADLIEALLVSLNDQLEADAPIINEQYILDEAEKFIKKRKILMLCEDVQAYVSRDKLLEAEGMVAQYNIPRRPEVMADDVFDMAFWEEEDEEKEFLFQFPGAVGKLLGPLDRDSFMAILAPEKRGKTWWLYWCALLAFKRGCNVALFVVGDLTKKQVRRRLRHMLTGQNPKYPKNRVVRPVLDCYYNQIGECPIDEDTDPCVLSGKGKVKKIGELSDFPDHIPCSKCSRDVDDNDQHFIGRPWWKEVQVSARTIDKAVKDTLKNSGKGNKFKLFVYPPKGINVAGMDAQLNIAQQQDDFVADLIVLDYADNLEEEDATRKLDWRQKINGTWTSLRALSQNRNCGLVAATQATREARKKFNMEQDDASEDKRKLAHVTSMIALNQTPQEKRQGIMRISLLAARDREFDTEKNAVVLECRAIGKPYLTSYMEKDVPYER